MSDLFCAARAPDLIQRRRSRIVASYRWIVLAFTWLALLISFVDRLAWGNLALDASRALGAGMTAAGAFVTAFYIGYVFSNAALGFATDRIGPRIILGAGLALLGALTFAFGLALSFIAGICIQAGMGIASGVDYAAGVKLISTWFDKQQRGSALGIYLTATSLAVVVANGAVPRLAGRWTWRGAYEILGAVTVVAGIISILVMRNAPGAGRRAALWKSDFSVLSKKPDLLLVAIAGFGAMWGTWGFAFWANALMVVGHGLSPRAAAGIMVLFGIGAILAKPAIGILSDRLGGRRKILTVVCLGAFGPALVAFGYSQRMEAFQYLAPLLGIFAFVYSPLLAAMVAEVAGTDLAAAATGLTNALWQIGSVIVPVAVGAVFEATHSFHATFAALAIGPAIGALIIAFVSAD